MSKRRFSRREFLELATVTAAGVALPKVMVGAAQASAATPESPKASGMLGAHLIGKLEGPEIIRDPGKFPKTFKEAPMLAELVKAGKLPPVEQRLPEPADLMVVRPLKEIGKYGGRWRRAFTGPADNENGNRIVSTDKILMFDYTGNKVAPSLAKDWRLSDDGQRIAKDWVVKNFMAGIDFFDRVAQLAEAEGHHPDLHLRGYRNVSIELYTHAIGGLSENDFILAAKIDKLPITVKK